jgi:hypothetical protein
MENLSKENFWDDITKRFPEAMELFGKWIDKYKEEVGWDRLFANGQYFIEPNGKGGHRSETKFHDIPFEMQNGILARFDIECFNGVLTGKGKAVYENGRQNYVKGFYNLFADLQKQLNKQNQ